MGIFGLVLYILVWGVIHSYLASLESKVLARRLLGQFVDRYYRLAYNLFAGVTFLPVLAIAALTPDRQLYLAPFPLSALMVMGELVAVVALMVGVSQTGAGSFLGLSQLSQQAPLGPTTARPATTKLVTGGLYRYVRHPLYSAGLLFIWLLPLMTVNVLVINASLTVYIIVGALFEERKLRREYGQEYVEYAAVTPMFIPFLKRVRQRL